MGLASVLAKQRSGCEAAGDVTKHGGGTLGGLLESESGLRSAKTTK
jgi:hypothetical protein